MLYYRFRNYEEFKEIFAVEKRSNGAEVRKNKILLSHLKNAALLKYCRERNDFTLLDIKDMAQLQQSVTDAVCSSGKRDDSLPHKVELIGCTYWSGQYRTDESRGICEDGDYGSIRYVNMERSRVFKMKSAKFLRAVMLETSVGKVLSPSVVNWLCGDVFTKQWYTFTLGCTSNMELHVDNNFEAIYDSYRCKGDFNSCMTDFGTRDGRIVSVTVNGKEKLPCCAAVLAIGQAARDTYRLLVSKGIELVPKPFAVGVRIEHPQDFINRSQFGRFAGHPRLGAAEYRLTGKSGSRGVYTFCMCPGGVVVASSSAENQVVTNGMSYHSRSERNANSAVIVQVNPSDFASADPLSGIIFQEKLENAAFRLGGGDYSAPAMRVGDFLNRKKPEHFGSVAPTYRPNAVPRDIRKCMPPAISNGIEDGIRTFARQIHNFDMYDAVLTAIESRSSSPVRIARDENGEATRLKGLYPVGEGAGYAGGIVSAAVDGMRAAERIISRFKPMRG